MSSIDPMRGSVAPFHEPCSATWLRMKFCATCIAERCETGAASATIGKNNVARNAAAIDLSALNMPPPLSLQDHFKIGAAAQVETHLARAAAHDWRVEAVHDATNAC